MKILENLIILVIVCYGAVRLYQELDKMGPESEPQSAQTETTPAETKPAASETPASTQSAPAATETTTTAAPTASATPALSTEPAAQPAAPATSIAEQPVTSTALPQPPVMPSQPAAPTVAPPPAPTALATLTPSPTAPPAPAEPAAAASSIPAPASVIPAPASVAPKVQPASQPPVQVATATSSSAPVSVPTTPTEPQKKLAEMTPDDLMARLPVQARSSYRNAHSLAESKGDMIGMLSWFSQWRRYLTDPMRAVLELDMAKLLIQSKANYANEAAAKSARRGNANEAKMLLNGIRARRITNAELSEMLEKAEQDVNRELEQIK